MRHPRKPFRVGLDLDGVFADFNGHPDSHGFARVLVETSGQDYFPRPWLGPTLWDWWTPLGYTRAHADVAWQRVKQTPFWGTLRAYNTALATLQDVRTLTRAGRLEAFFLTTRPGETAMAQSKEWLEARGVPDAVVVICANADAKGVMARELNLQLMVDDHCENLLAVKAHSRARIVLYDQPWSTPNRDRVLSCGALVVRDHQQLSDKLKEWSGV